MKTILKRSSKECVVKISGDHGTSETISIINDIFSKTEIYLNPKVNIIGLTWYGNADSTIQISRNNVIVATLQANTTGQFDFQGQGMCPDNVENTSDLVVSITGAQHEVWIRLHKMEGYESKIETGVFSVYDDVTKVGE
jgi:hypothetical protein